MSDVFISYSRKDGEFVAKLQSGLEAQQRDVWVDWQDIPPTAEWLREIYGAIEAADTFVFIVSPDSVTSRTCLLELTHAQSHHKRVVPVLVREVDQRAVPEAIAKINWMTFVGRADFGELVKSLDSAIELDLARVRAHTRLLVRAREWADNGEDSSYLLKGTDLAEARRRQTEAAHHPPKFTDLQVSYLAASEQGTIADQKRQLRGFYVVSIIYSALQMFVSYFIVFDEISETGLVYLSPVWLLGLVFGVTGLTFGQISLRRSIIITVLAGVALFVFFNTLWSLL